MTSNNQTKILRMKEVSARIGLCKAMVYRLQKQGNFPKSVKLGQRATGWYEHEIEAWLAARTSVPLSVSEVRHA